MAAAGPEILKIWEEGDRFIVKGPLRCPDEIEFSPNVGRSYYQCQPHLWQCYWEGGLTPSPAIKLSLFGRDFHIDSRAAFPAIKKYSEKGRHYQMFKRPHPGIDLHYGYVVELHVKEIPGLTQAMILTDTCRDTYLPERFYVQGLSKDKRDLGFIWDNFDRRIFIDKFYVSNQQINEWRLLTGQEDKVITDRKLWPSPALLSAKEQGQYCSYLGKRPLESHFFDAATMSPVDLKDPTPDRPLRPDTPWHRDLSKTFLGMARINSDYQLTPLDCQLAQVQGCDLRFFTTDSASWMGINFPLGFFPEVFVNSIEPERNLKLSSRFLPAHSEWHELGLRGSWKGEQGKGLPVAFRCYEETVL